MTAQPVEGTLGEISSSPSPPPSSSSPSASSSLSPSSIVTCSIPPVAFSDKSTNSGLEAGELFPILHVNSRSLTGNTHALYSSPASTVTFGKVATYSIISEPAAGFMVEGDKVVRLEGAKNASISKN
jgi:hypothetical protein